MVLPLISISSFLHPVKDDMALSLQHSLCMWCSIQWTNVPLYQDLDQRMLMPHLTIPSWEIRSGKAHNKVGWLYFPSKYQNLGKNWRLANCIVKKAAEIELYSYHMEPCHPTLNGQRKTLMEVSCLTSWPESGLFLFPFSQTHFHYGLQKG